jgi:hypothetical protein
MTSFSIGVAVSVLAIGAVLSSPADAQSNRQQMRADGGQWSHGVTVMPRNTPRDYVVCWNGCNNPASIVMGADPDPFIRQQILRDGSGFFGGGDR